MRRTHPLFKALSLVVIITFSASNITFAASTQVVPTKQDMRQGGDMSLARLQQATTAKDILIGQKNDTAEDQSSTRSGDAVSSAVKGAAAASSSTSLNTGLYITEKELLHALPDAIQSIHLPGGKISIYDLKLDLGGGIVSPHSDAINIDLRAVTEGINSAAIRTKGDDGIVKVLKYLNDKGASAQKIYFENINFNAKINWELSRQSGELLGPTGEIQLIPRPDAKTVTTDIGPAGNSKIVTDIDKLQTEATKMAEQWAKDAKGTLSKPNYEVRITRPNGVIYDKNLIFKITKSDSSETIKGISNVGSKALKGLSVALIVGAVVLSAWNLADAYQKDKKQDGGCDLAAAVGQEAGGWSAALGTVAVASLAGAPVTLGTSLAVGGIAAVAAYFTSQLGGYVGNVVCQQSQKSNSPSPAQSKVTTPAPSVSKENNSTKASNTKKSNKEESVPSKAAETVSKAVEKVADTTKAVVKKTVDAAKSVVKKVSDTVKSASSKVVKAASNTVKKASSIIKSIAQKVTGSSGKKESAKKSKKK